MDIYDSTIRSACRMGMDAAELLQHGDVKKATDVIETTAAEEATTLAMTASTTPAAGDNTAADDVGTANAGKEADGEATNDAKQPPTAGVPPLLGRRRNQALADLRKDEDG